MVADLNPRNAPCRIYRRLMFSVENLIIAARLYWF